MKLLEGPKDSTVNKKVLDIIRATESLYYKYDPKLSEEMFLIQQLGTLLSNLMDDHPEIEKDVQGFIDHLILT